MEPVERFILLLSVIFMLNLQIQHQEFLLYRILIEYWLNELTTFLFPSLIRRARRRCLRKLRLLPYAETVPRPRNSWFKLHDHNISEEYFRQQFRMKKNTFDTVLNMLGHWLVTSKEYPLWKSVSGFHSADKWWQQSIVFDQLFQNFPVPNLRHGSFEVFPFGKNFPSEKKWGDDKNVFFFYLKTNGTFSCVLPVFKEESCILGTSELFVSSFGCRLTSFIHYSFPQGKDKARDRQQIGEWLWTMPWSAASTAFIDITN